ncbi:MAG TPA: type II toxin-antitoxin system ParD family antitoxin [Caulobacterales bacterium]|jgi:antitoxin ParD1/3/4|nr:type II toxin-antitoxin system ParD family antitoxin [Caulobacterales bacterium]
MTAKTSISLTDSQEAFARGLVARGRYASVSAVLQHGLELLRSETETEDAELAALKALIESRRGGAFVSVKQGRARTRRMIAAKKRDGV